RGGKPASRSISACSHRRRCRHHHEHRQQPLHRPARCRRCTHRCAVCRAGQLNRASISAVPRVSSPLALPGTHSTPDRSKLMTSPQSLSPASTSKDADQLLDFDANHLLHPYASMTQPLPNFLVTGAKGVELQLADGRVLVDGMSSWWSAIHGYNHPILNEAATRQLQEMSHVMFGGLTHEPAIELARRLLTLCPPGLDKVF